MATLFRTCLMADQSVDNETVNLNKTIECTTLTCPEYSIWIHIFCILSLIKCYIQAKTGRYVPPHVRGKTVDEDTNKQEQLKRLQRQMKGLLNRLAENNMNSIALQVCHPASSLSQACRVMNA